MRKTFYKILFTIILATSICAFIGCKANFSSATIFIANYANITAIKYDDKNISLFVENKIFNDEDSAKALHSKICKDYSALKEVFGGNPKIKIFVLYDEYALADGCGYMNGAIYCTLPAINSGEYRAYLSGAFLKTTEPWKQRGAANFVFGQRTDIAALTEYYSQANNLPALSAFAAYFTPAFSDEQTINAVNQTAYALTDHIINTHGKKAFLSANLNDYRAEFLRTLGVDAEYNPIDLSFVENAEYSVKWLQYPLVITTPTRIFNLAPVVASAGYEEFTFDTPFAVMKTLSQYEGKIQTIMEFLKQSAPSIYPKIEKRNEKIEFFISEKEIKTGANIEEKRVYLVDTSEYVHETTHILCSSGKDFYPAAWLYEGLAQYLSGEVVRSGAQIDKRMYLSIFEDLSYNPSLQEFIEKCKAYYTANGGDLSSYQEFDMGLFQQAMGHYTLINPDYKKGVPGIVSMSVADRSYPRPVGSYEGNELTYNEALLFTHYLIDEFGFEKVVSAVFENSYDFAKTFGVTHAQAFEEFISKLKD